MNIDSLRADIRERIWRLLEESGEARPPKPVRGRIPNFRGAEIAAKRLFSLKEWKDAKVVKVNPDSPQRPIRLQALKEGKLLVMPTPRIKRGFLLLNPNLIPNNYYSFASTIKGAFKFGKLLPTLRDVEREIPKIDLIVEGSVAVDRNCNRLGKGEGYGDIEWAILSLLGKVDRRTPIATTVSELQIVDAIPKKPHDLPLDIIVTPKRVIRCNRHDKPFGIILESLTKEKVEEIPLLNELLKFGHLHIE
ncbi:MAG: 5-formyltetrahydrofolate cyclo-ligase [Thermococcus sp.]|uniref:5-formyltetrahydrofolate cyclo-ligase n=1 Tax=Thermococcus sp. TaxID=35749 RepID=UPI001D969211|nr:5-formyltetrahydrofolate cyclo-ligase [Thermococcus sp.]MBO8174351.1 5-formyltetrahydrofolate cyclo-ligase [Thermococcus sp.]